MLRENAETGGSVDLNTLKQRLVDRHVRWQGTLKYFRKGRPYIRESFVRVDEETKLAAVMFYADPDDVQAWERLERGSAVEYSGVISDVKVETVMTKTPFIFIELRHVKVVKPGSASKPPEETLGAQART